MRKQVLHPVEEIVKLDMRQIMNYTNDVAKVLLFFLMIKDNNTRSRVLWLLLNYFFFMQVKLCTIDAECVCDRKFGTLSNKLDDQRTVI